MAADSFVSGKLRQEFWQDKGRADVENGTAGPPTAINYIDMFHLPVEQGANYVERISGFFIPPTTGKYVFFVVSDDQSDLFLSTDENPANKRLIAQETSWSNDLEWTVSGGGSNLGQKRSDQFVAPGSTNKPFAGGIDLTAGQRYYIEGVHNEGGGGDDFAVTYKLLADPAPETGTETLLTGAVIGLLAPSTPTFVTQPLNRRVLADATPTLTAVAEPATAQIQWFKNGTAISGATSNSYTLPAITAGDNGATFYATATAGGSTVQSSNVTITVGQLVSVPGAKEEFWSQDTLGGTADRTIVEDPNFATPPDRTTIYPKFETPSDQSDNYINRLSGLFIAPVTGDYVFFVSADDDTDLFLSTDDTPANKRQIAAEVNWADDRTWITNEGGTANHELEQKRSDKWVPDPANPPATPPFASGIHLVQGSKYYLEAVHHDGTGGDNLAVTYILKGEADPPSGSPTRIVASMLAPYGQGMNGARVNIAAQPQNTSAVQNRSATFTTTATAGYVGDDSSASPGVAYQWQAAAPGSSTFTNISGANDASYTTPNLSLAQQGTQYRVIYLSGDTNVTSSVATLSVTADTTAPAGVGISSVNAAGTQVTLSLNEVLDKTSAETAANYSFGGIAVTNAVLDATGTNLTLRTGSPIAANTNVTLTINGTKDLAGNAASNVTLTFSFKPVTYEENIRFDNPLGYYRFEETSGSVAKNSGSTGGDGAYYAGDEITVGEGATPATAKGDPGPRPPQFAGFDAANHSATFTGPDVGQEWVDTKNQFLQNRAAFTLEYWVRPTGRTNTADGTVLWPGRVGIVGQNDAIEYGFIDPDTIQIWTAGGGSLDTDYTFPDDEWHHVATITDGSSIKTYYDGVLKGTTTQTSANYGSSTYNVHIGGSGVFDNVGNYFTGNIDEVAIFDKAIPANRVAEHFRAGKEGGVLVTNAGGPQPGGIQVTAARSGANLSISWSPAGGTLQSANALTGQASDWTDVGPTNPATVPIGATGNKFYRVRQ